MIAAHEKTDVSTLLGVVLKRCQRDMSHFARFDCDPSLDELLNMGDQELRLAEI